MTFSTICAIGTITASFFAGVTSIISMRHKKKVANYEEQIRSLKDKNNRKTKELIELYSNVEKLKKIEKQLTSELGISIKKGRKDITLTERFEDARIRKRLEQLKSSVKEFNI